MLRRPSRRSFLAAAAVGSASLAGCTVGYQSTTVDATSSLDPRSTPATPLDDAPLAPKWETSIPGQFTLSTPGVDAHRLYVGSASRMTAIVRDRGEVAWHADLGGLTHGFTPAVDDGTLIASARDIVGRRSVVDRGGSPSLTALDAASGEREWREKLPVSASPVVSDGTVFVPLVDDDGAAVAARDAATGGERWTTQLSTPDVFAAPAVGEGVYVATRTDADGEGRLVALTRDGDVRWEKALEGEAYKGPRVAGGGETGERGAEAVFVGTDAGYVYAFEADGSERWTASLGGAVNTTPAVAGGRVYTTAPQKVVALEADTGAGLWSGAVDHVDKTGLGLGGGRVHVGGNEVAAFDAADGAARWRIELPGVAGTFGSPIWRDGTLYTGACVKIEGSSLYNHVVYALA